MITIKCACPGSPHESDTVSLRETLTPRDAMAISKDIGVLRLEDPDLTAGDILAVLTEGYILRGVESWSLVDEDGKALEVTKANIRERLLSDLEIATDIGDVADDLYAEAVMLPLLRQASSSSQPTPTDSTPVPPSSTSAPTDSGPTPLTPSTPSSTSTIPTADTGTTYSSPDGDSSFSRSSVSAA